MRAVAFALVAGLLAGPAAATQDAFPALYDVAGVASDDVLNVRAEPDASSEIIGALPPDARNVEVIELAPRVDWGRVNVNGTSGWVSLRFMERHPGQYLGAVPEVARCAGTEPFWSLSREGRDYVFSGPDLDETAYSPGWRGAAEGRRDRYAVTLRNGRAEATAVIAYARCSDGMSDYRYGLTLDLIREGGPDGPALYSGCCSLSR
ncbi:SH3 domain-containing protein [Pseudooceanicola sp.]|jgi:uncharacterized membrane protein|uniref:SH3 domain-containing protein n=1 Tax=Pseudooceanicola sp. TaxID=1914328 RepID=UPI004059F8C5